MVYNTSVSDTTMKPLSKPLKNNTTYHTDLPVADQLMVQRILVVQKYSTITTSLNKFLIFVNCNQQIILRLTSP